MTFNLQLRLVIALILDVGLLFLGWPRLAVFSSVEAQAWTHFWTAGASCGTLGLLWAIVWRGPKPARFAAAFLSVVPLAMLGLVAYSFFRNR
jgi:hypothetical protein